jgi:hypothetical protein
LKSPSFVSAALTPNGPTPLGNSQADVVKALNASSVAYRRIIKEADIALD